MQCLWKKRLIKEAIRAHNRITLQKPKMVSAQETLHK